MQHNRIDKSILLNADREKVWDILTNPEFAKILGNELDEGAFLESDWEEGAFVYFKYEPDKLIATGVIKEYQLYAHVFVDYQEINYNDSYTLAEKNGKTVLTISSGPYQDDYEEQQKVWTKWLMKVKQLSEM